MKRFKWETYFKSAVADAEELLVPYATDEAMVEVLRGLFDSSADDVRKKSDTDIMIMQCLASVGLAYFGSRRAAARSMEATREPEVMLVTLAALARLTERGVVRNRDGAAISGDGQRVAAELVAGGLRPTPQEVWAAIAKIEHRDPDRDIVLLVHKEIGI